VVLVAQMVLLDKGLSAEVSTWQTLETSLGSPILGTSLTIASGTGFFVDTEGKLLTNQHVTTVGDEAKRIRELVSSIQDYISTKVDDTVLSAEQKFKLRIDTARILKGAKISIKVQMASGDFLDTKVIASQDKIDLALLQVAVSTPTPALLLSPSDAPLSLGVPVTAVGFPIPDLFDSLFDQKRLTVTQGNVSALRDEVWGIQHTAALNPGNSGGPLLDDQGAVVGVNVGAIRNANSLFFAIDLRHINQFFQDSGNFSVWQANQALGAQRPQLTSLTQKTVGDTVILNSEKGAEVFLDGKKVGTVPLVLTLTKATTLIRLQGASGESSLVLNRDATVNQTMTVDVPLGPREGTLALTSTPPGAVVFVDGVTRGKTPFSGLIP